jgi:hypothetical protein
MTPEQEKAVLDKLIAFTEANYRCSASLGVEEIVRAYLEWQAKDRALKETTA